MSWMRKVLGAAALMACVLAGWGSPAAWGAASGRDAVTSAMSPGHPVASTATGRVRGRTVGGTDEFLGIPYAAPPVGPLRWQPPQPAAPWSGVREATAFGPACPQPAIRAFGNIPGPQSEDCLYLNVWAPASATPD